jgi:hypothetical protein
MESAESDRTWFRLHPRGDDPERLLDPERQRSEPWGGTVYGRCPKCGGEGRTLHECESCRELANPSCPACGGPRSYRGALSREELEERAKEEGIRGRTEMSKQELVEALADD